MAKENEEKKEEPEMLINPKAEEMCAFEEKNYPRCSECAKTIYDQQFCALGTIKWRLAQMDKALQQIGEILIEIKNKQG